MSRQGRTGSEDNVSHDHAGVSHPKTPSQHVSQRWTRHEQHHLPKHHPYVKQTCHIVGRMGEQNSTERFAAGEYSYGQGQIRRASVSRKGAYCQLGCCTLSDFGLSCSLPKRRRLLKELLDHRHLVPLTQSVYPIYTILHPRLDLRQLPSHLHPAPDPHISSPMTLSTPHPSPPRNYSMNISLH